MESTTAFNIGVYLGSALAYSFPALIIIIGKLVGRLISRKVVKNTTIWVYGIIFTIMMLLFFKSNRENFTLGAVLVTLFLYLLYFYIDYLFYTKSKSKI